MLFLNKTKNCHNDSVSPSLKLIRRAFDNRERERERGIVDTLEMIAIAQRNIPKRIKLNDRNCRIVGKLFRETQVKYNNDDAHTNTETKRGKTGKRGREREGDTNTNPPYCP